MNSPLILLLLILLFLVIQGCFSMLEMASVSFNTLRLHYLVGKKKGYAVKLYALLSRPTYLFSTTLIGVNIALQCGSECARLFYHAIGFNPDWAFLSQVILVLIFAELLPMFIGRHYPEYVIKGGVRVLAFASYLFFPLVFCLEGLSSLVHKLIRLPLKEKNFWSREELQKAIELSEEKKERHLIVEKIFSLKNQTLDNLMVPLDECHMVSDKVTVGELKRRYVKKNPSPYFPIYQGKKERIVGIVHLRDLLRLSDSVLIKEYARSPWFISESSAIYSILEQFRSNNQSSAVVLNHLGSARGILTLDAVCEEIFSHTPKGRMNRGMIDRLFRADTSIDRLEKLCSFKMQGAEKGDTLESLMARLLGHHPSEGESVRVGSVELLVQEATLLDGKKVLVKTVK